MNFSSLLLTLKNSFCLRFSHLFFFHFSDSTFQTTLSTFSHFQPSPPSFFTPNFTIFHTQPPFPFPPPTSPFLPLSFPPAFYFRSTSDPFLLTPASAYVGRCSGAGIHPASSSRSDPSISRLSPLLCGPMGGRKIWN